MSAWPFSKRRFQRGAEAGQVQAGLFASPGLKLLVDAWVRRPPATVLDLGPTSTESLDFLTSHAENVEVWDLFQSAAEARVAGRGSRAEIFRFDPAEIDLPDEPHDALLAWDLLHYFAPADRELFGRALADVATEGALLHLVASNIARIPATPIHFKIRGKVRRASGEEYLVDYALPSEPEQPTPALQTRQVEKALPGFRPIRHFQLRNGLQELVFQRS